MAVSSVPAMEAKLSRSPGKAGIAVFGAALLVGVVYAAIQLSNDLSIVQTTSLLPFLLLGGALLTALGFEFVNGFHDTANAVATVIYTHSLEPHAAVVWSGLWNLAGVLASTGAVAFGIIALLPVELILQVGTGAGFAMVFALLIAAVIWNLGTWYFGIPNSSSHTLVGSIIGVGVANQLLAGHSGTSGVDWTQAASVGNSLFFSPIAGFVVAGLLLLVAKLALTNASLFIPPTSTEPPPFWTRVLLILTCTGVSFAHGSNDGQKGMGLIMLILIGVVPTAYALNRAVPASETADFAAVSQQTAQVLNHYADPTATVDDPRGAVETYLRTKAFTPTVVTALRNLVDDISGQVVHYESYARVPGGAVRNLRNDMYVASTALTLMQKSHTPAFSAADARVISNYKSHLDRATKFIPGWVKVAVAMALGLGTMIGWKRIVVTVGEKIGKQHLTYGQGAAAEITTMAMITAADHLGLPVSTTHVLSSSVGGTMAANGAGLQWATVRNMVAAWVLTLPASIMLSGLLFALFRRLF